MDTYIPLNTNYRKSINFDRQYIDEICFSYLRFDTISYVISSINYKQIYNIRHLQLSNTTYIGVVKMIKKYAYSTR
jgi:hypothetical protein